MNYFIVLESCVYSITNKINNKKYIGFTFKFIKRKNDHINALRKNNHVNTYLQNAWNKYGEENFIFEVLEFCSKNNLAKREDFWVKMFNTTNKKNGYNIKLTDPNNKTIHSKETKLKISTSKKGKPSSRRGIKQTKEHSEKIRFANLGKKRSNKTKEKISLSAKNKIVTFNTRKKISDIHKGRKIKWADKIKETHLKSKNKKRRKVLQFDLNENLIKEWSSLLEIERELGINNANLYKCCKQNIVKNKKFSTLKNYIWKFKE